MKLEVENDIPKPFIHKTSSGTVIMPGGKSKDNGSSKPHNPYRPGRRTYHTRYAEPRHGVWGIWAQNTCGVEPDKCEDKGWREGIW
jgi:hypothetical protein